MSSSSDQSDEHKKSGDSQQMAFAWTSWGTTPRTDAGTATAPPNAEKPGNHVGYGPGHPWHYLQRGDNAQPSPIEAIQSATMKASDFDHDLPKARAKRVVKAR